MALATAIDRSSTTKSALSQYHQRLAYSMQRNDEEVPTVYHSYLVRLWQEYPGAPWRASAQSVQSGKLIHFATLTALATFLLTQEDRIPTKDALPAATQEERVQQS